MTTPSSQDYRRIPLTRGLFAIVDAADYDELSKYKWYAQWHPRTKTFYAHRCYGVRSRSAMSMHRHLMGLKPGDGKCCDHINQDTLDNRRQNLRIASLSQNMANRRRHKTNKCGFKGVFLSRPGKWRAQIQVNNEPHHLGYFSSPQDAYEAYKRAAYKFFGEYARLS